MNTFTFVANDLANPLTDLKTRLEQANKANNLCIFADEKQFTFSVCNEIYNFFNGGLRFEVLVNASFSDGFIPVFGKIYNPASSELLRFGMDISEDQTEVVLLFSNFEEYFSQTAQDEIKAFLGGVYS